MVEVSGGGGGEMKWSKVQKSSGGVGRKWRGVRREVARSGSKRDGGGGGGCGG